MMAEATAYRRRRSMEAEVAQPAGVGHGSEENGAETSKRVGTAVYPFYSEVRKLLTVLPGWPRSQVTRLRAKVYDLTGTPQEPVDWTDPDKWIEKKLTG